LAGMIEILQSPACLLGAGGEVTQLNSDWRSRTGELVAGRAPRLAELVDPRDAPAVRAAFEAPLSSARRDIECRLPEVQGEARWHRLTLHPLADGGAAGSGWLCIGTDIHDLKETEERLLRQAAIQTDMLSASVDCIKLIALDGTLLSINRSGCQALGVDENSGFGMAWLPLLPAEVRAAGEIALAQARAGSFARFAGRSELPGEKPLYWDNMLTPVMGPDGKPNAILCVSREVTAEQDALRRLRESEERLAIATRVGGLGIWDFDIRTGELECDEGWYRIMGRDPAQPIRSIEEFRPCIHPDDVARATEVDRTAQDLVRDGRDYAIKFRIVRPDGDVRWVRSAAAVIRNAAGESMRAVGFVVDITEAVRSEQALLRSNRELEAERSWLARENREDPLTGIANRRHLDAELERLFEEARRNGLKLCVGMVDVDQFKAYNDHYGHLAGDAALRAVAGVLKEVVRKSDLVARYGGEEFAFVLTGTENPGPLLQRLQAGIAALGIAHAGSPTGFLTVSCGCVIVPCTEGMTARSLLMEADALLYEAKLGGRNQSRTRRALGHLAAPARPGAVAPLLAAMPAHHS
jgi:diguanylate cyclase (GGDEF)-like protein